MRCRSCGYDLQGLEEHRCPECGRRFDRAKPDTYLTKPVSGRSPLLASLLALALIGLPVLVASLEDRGPTLPDHWLAVLPLSMMMPAGLILGWFVLQKATRAIRGQLPWVIHPRAFVAAFIFSLLAVLGTFGAIVFVLLDRMTP